jgi:hypothetical protein
MALGISTADQSGRDRQQSRRVLDFSKRNLNAPRFNVPRGPFGLPCMDDVLDDEITNLAALRI